MPDSLANMIILMRQARRKLHCRQCRHPISTYGVRDWRCSHGCRCLMLGCVLDRERLEADLNGD